MKRKEFAGVED